MVFPRTLKSGIARLVSASSPPTMTARRASIAPTSPPETGASSVWNGGLFAAARFAISRDAAGLMVLMSIARRPGCAPAAMPSGPKVTASTSGELVTMVTTRSERAATSFGVRTTVAPASARGFARSSVRFVTVTGKPALMAFRAMGEPMIPSPTKPMRSIVTGSVLDVVVAREEHAAVAGFLGDEERPFLGHVDVHRSHEQIVRHVDECPCPSELVRDRLGERVFLVCIDEQCTRLLHQREELERLEAAFVGEEHGGAEVLVAFMDLVEEHLLATSLLR